MGKHENAQIVLACTLSTHVEGIQRSRQGMKSEILPGIL